jgi:ribosomal protein S18 acetylase RimI-like enzyme
LRLATFNWTGFVEKGALSANLVGGAVAVGVATLGKPPLWMIHSDRLLFLSLALAFTRVWKTVREEGETASLWELVGQAVSSRGSGMHEVRDAVFEIPYLFSILFLPAAAISLQTFALCLVLFYVSDNFYNLAILRGIARSESARPRTEPEPIPGRWRRVRRAAGRVRRAAGRVRRRTRRGASRMLRLATRGRLESVIAIVGDALETVLPIGHPHANTIDREVLTYFFRRRVLFNRIAILLLGLVLGVVWFGNTASAEAAGSVVVFALLIMELVVEPPRVLGVQFESPEPDSHLLLWPVPAGTNLDAESYATLKRIHEDSFLAPEQQFSVDLMLHKTGRRGYRLLLLTKGSDAKELVGYLFLRARPELEIVFFWYLAVDKKRQRQGLGSEMVKLALDLVRDRWPSVQAVFLEANDEVVEFYRRLGFWRALHVDYSIPAEDDPKKPLYYNPMFFRLRGLGDPLDTALVKKAVRAMAADSFDDRHDPRLTALVTSLANLEPLGPPEGARPRPHWPCPLRLLGRIVHAAHE